MKAYEIADTFRAILESDPAFAAVCKRGIQSSDEPEYPLIRFSATTRPLSASVISFELAIITESEANDTNDAAHAALVELVRAKFLGAAPADYSTARAAIKASVAALGSFVLLGRGLDQPAEPQSAEIQATRFETPLILAGTVQVV